VRQNLVELLSGSGYRCDTAPDGDEAFAQMARLKPSVTVVDMREASEDDRFFVALLRKRFPEIGVVRLLEGKALIDCGKSGHVMEFHNDTLPTGKMLQRAVEWVLAERSLRTLVPRVGSA
jgi:CheY-like chemotaxis protein